LSNRKARSLSSALRAYDKKTTTQAVPTSQNVCRNSTDISVDAQDNYCWTKQKRIKRTQINKIQARYSKGILIQSGGITCHITLQN